MFKNGVNSQVSTFVFCIATVCIKNKSTTTTLYFEQEDASITKSSSSVVQQTQTLYKH